MEANQNQLSLSPILQKKIAVISHERSGTHFLMNTLALNFGYLSQPWWNFDYDIPINFHSFETIKYYFNLFHNKPVLNILKSHHPFSFFTDFSEYFADQFKLLYIYRDPYDVMVSFMRLLFSFSWDEGPKTQKISEFIRCAPSSGILRYQKKQEPTMLHRWQTHVESWLHYSEKNPSLFVVKYEDLNLDFEKTVRKLGEFLGKEVTDPIKKPEVNQNVIGFGTGKIGAYRNLYTDDDNQFVIDIVGDTMKRLGYQ